MPDWLSEALVAAIAGMLGFLAKYGWDEWQARRSAGQHELRELQSLRNLLREAGSIFRSQNYQAKRLLKLLRLRLGEDTVPRGIGYDNAFTDAFQHMEKEERELHAILRSTTMNSLHRVNEDMQRWIDANGQFLHSSSTSTQARRNFAEDLHQLDLHLNQWLDKYAAIIPSDERRCLVYLADEKKHGVGFPKRVESTLEQVITEYGR